MEDRFPNLSLFNWDDVSERVKGCLVETLKELGDLKPWFDDRVLAFIYTHYRFRKVGYGRTPEDALEHYKQQLVVGIETNLKNGWHYSDFHRKRGGCRPHAGRPKKDPTERMRVPKDLVPWLRTHAPWDALRQLRDHQQE
jgi:hypothetical protein